MLVLLGLMLSGYQNVKEKRDSSDGELDIEKIGATEEPQYISDTPADKCKLCGDGEGTLLSIYWGEENIGIISLNTFNLAHIRINRYDDFGKLIEEPAQRSSMRMTNTKEGGFSFMISEDSDRGYANCDLNFNNDEVLDIEQAATHMCTDCMNCIIDDDGSGEPTGIAVINFNTGELRLLRENLAAFQFGDYYISCRAKRDEKNDNSLEMALLVFYCPKRYGD